MQIPGAGYEPPLNAAQLITAGNRSRVLKFPSMNFNSTSDQAMTGFPSRYQVTKILVENASANLTTAAGGIYTSTAKGGSPIVIAATVYTALTTAAKFLSAALAGTSLTDILTGATLYLSLTLGQGSAATADIWVFYEDLSA